MGIAIRTWIGHRGTETEFAYGEDRQHLIGVHQTVPDATPITFYVDDFAGRLETTIGEIRAWLKEKRAQAEAAEVAARQATEPPTPPGDLTDTPAPVPESDGPVSQPVTPAEDTAAGDAIPAAAPIDTNIEF